MEYVKLKKVAKVQGGYAFKSKDFTSNSIPVIKIGNIVNNKVVIDNKVTILNKGIIKEHPEIIVKKGDILIAMSGATVGKIGVYDNKDISLLNQRVAKFIVNDKIQINYLYYVLQSASFKKYILNNAFGCAQPNISGNQIENFEFKIYSIDQQNEIINQLNIISKIISLKQEQINNLDKIIKSQFVEMFENDKYPKDEFINLSKEIYAGGDKPKDISRIKTEEYLYPVFANGYENEGLQGYSKNYRTKDESVTISARGTIGYSSIRKGKFTPIVRLITITPNERVNVIYLKYAIDNINIAGSGTSQAQLTVPNVKKQKIIVPPIELQNQFADIVKQIDKQKFEGQRFLEECNLIMNTIGVNKKVKNTH